MESHWASFELRLDPIFRKRLNLTCRMARKNLNQHSLNRLCTAAFRSRCQLHRKRGSRRPVSGRKTQAPKQTSGRERLSRPDLCVAPKCHILINHQPGRFDVTMQCATRLKLAAFSHENIALHRPSQLHRFRPDLTAYARVFPDRERSGGIDCASTSPSMSSSFRNLTEPLIETPRERIAPDCVGMNVLLDGPGTTDGSG